MVKLKCQDCGRIVEVKEDWNIDATCDECQGSFAELNSEDDTYKKDSEEEENEEYNCEECEEVFDIESDLIYFENQEIYICKECIDRLYPKKIEIKTEYKEKIIEKPIIKYLDKDNQEVKIIRTFEEKSKFD